MSKEKIYLDELGIKNLKAEIEDLRKQLKKKSTFNREDTTDGYNTSIAEANRHDETLIDLLNIRLEELARVVLIQKQDNADLIDLDDILKVNFEDGKNLIFKLVGRDGDFSKEIPDISINSPIGQAVYQKHIGDLCSYRVNGKLINITIEEKITLNPTDIVPQR